MLVTQTRKKKVPWIMRDILAANVKSLMEREFDGCDNKPMTLAKKADVSLSTVQRLLNCEAGASVDTIEAVALALGCSPYQLLLPELDASNPQVVAGATAAEKRLYSRLRNAPA